MPLTKPATFMFATLLAVVVVFSVHALDFPGSVPRFQRVSGGGILLDAVPAFTVDDVYCFCWPNIRNVWTSWQEFYRM